jgi:hypothetical protein
MRSQRRNRRGWFRNRDGVIRCARVTAQHRVVVADHALFNVVLAEALSEVREELRDLQIWRQTGGAEPKRCFATDEERRMRRKRTDRLIQELRASIDRRKAIVADWRVEGILPPEQPRRRF